MGKPHKETEASRARRRQRYLENKAARIAYNKQRVEERKKKGLCITCANPAGPTNRFLCDACLSAKRNASREYCARYKERTFLHYCNGEIKCQKCGFSDVRALTIDHINGDGAEHRQTVKGSLYCWLHKRGYPLGFQVLCMNCQFIKRTENQEFFKSERYEHGQKI